MKTRMQITLSEEVKEKMEYAKDFYGGYSALIEKAVTSFLDRPVEPYPEDISDAETARTSGEWTSLDVLKRDLSSGK